MTSEPQTPPSTEGPIIRLIRSFTTPRGSQAVITPTPSPLPSESNLSPQDATAPELIDVKAPEAKGPTPLERFWKHARRSRTADQLESPSRFASVNSSPDTDSNIISVYKNEQPSENAPVALEESEPSTSSIASNVNNTSTLSADDIEPSPQTLAHGIQSMISSIPAMSSPALSDSDEIQSQTPASSAQSSIADSKLLSFLSSPKLMNGSLSNGQQSVWSILERLGSPSPNPAPPLQGESAELRDSRAKGKAHASNDDDEYDFDSDGSSVMLCSPLIPQRDSMVELAETEYVSIDDLGRMIAQQSRSPLRQLQNMSPEIQQELQDPDAVQEDQGRHVGNERTLNNEEAGQEMSASADCGESQDQIDSQPRSIGLYWPWGKTTGDDLKTKSKPKEKRIWVPSTTNISLQTYWWGYRIYLPPPVLAVLNNKQLQAAKRAAMITTALKWLLDNIPMGLIPAQFHLAIKLVKSLVPLLGYIGGFIAWSWSGIKTFDKGYGVTLTATWLLPIALVPGTWQAYEMPPISDEGTSEPSTGPPTTPPAVEIRGTDSPQRWSHIVSILRGSEPPSTQPSTSTKTPQAGDLANEEASKETQEQVHDKPSSGQEQATDTIDAGALEGSSVFPADATSVYQESTIGSYYYYYLPPQRDDSLDMPNLYTSPVAFVPPPVIVRTVPLPGDDD